MNTNPMDCKELKQFTVECLFGETPWLRGRKAEEKKRIRQHWDNAGSIEDFRAAVLGDVSLEGNQGYAELSKETPDHWKRVRAMFGERCFKTESDAGSVLVASKDRSFRVMISNYIGDGTTRCAIFERGEEFNRDMMNYTGILLSGNMVISVYDCVFSQTKELNGRYSVYAYEGLVAFVEC